MNTIFIVLPILTVLMFDLGLALKPQDFKLFMYRPMPIVAGLIGQIVMLPLIAWVMHLTEREHRTIVIEVGMQNAAQAITIACSPIVFNNETIAVPAIIYALMMNIVLLCYVSMVRKNFHLLTGSK